MRNFIRHPSDIPIEIRYLGQSLLQERQLNNVSIGGLSLQTNIYLDKGTIIDVKIPVVKPVFETKARVVWCEKSGDHFDVGAEFTEEKEAFRAKMVEQVCYIQHYKKEVEEKEGRILTAREAAQEWVAKFAKDFPDISANNRNY